MAPRSARASAGRRAVPHRQLQPQVRQLRLLAHGHPARAGRRRVARGDRPARRDSASSRPTSPAASRCCAATPRELMAHARARHPQPAPEHQRDPARRPSTRRGARRGRAQRSTCRSTARTPRSTSGSAARPGRSTRPSTHLRAAARAAATRSAAGPDELHGHAVERRRRCRRSCGSPSELRVQLYLNLATDHTFLFRDGQVSIEARVDQATRSTRRWPRSSRCCGPTAASCRATRSWRYLRGALRGPAAEAAAVRRVAAEADGPLDRRGRRLLGTRRDGRTCATRPLRGDPRRRGLPRGARAVLPQGVRGLRQQLRAEPRAGGRARTSATCCGGWAGDAGPAARREAERAAVRRAWPPTTTSTSPSPHRRAYDELAWEVCAAVLPGAAGRGRRRRLRGRPVGRAAAGGRAPGDRDRAGAGDGRPPPGAGSPAAT